MSVVRPSDRLRSVALLVLVGGLACHAAAADSTTEPGSTEPGSAAAGDVPAWRAGEKPTCVVTLPEATAPRKILVNGTPTGQEVGPEFGLTAFAYNDDMVAFALLKQWRPWFPAPEASKLQVVRCEAPHDVSVLVEREGADFGHSVVGPDGKTLYFSHGGVHALDLQSLQVSEVTQRPQRPVSPGCEGGDEPQQDLVMGLSEDRKGLLVHRFAPCGFEDEWEGREYALTPLDVNPRFLARSGVAAVAAEASGTLWVGDAGRCEAPGMQDAQTRGVVWRSKNNGASWTPIRFEEEQDPKEQYTISSAVARIEVGSKPGQVVVQTGICETTGVGTYGGKLYVTEDGGDTWRRVNMPQGFAEAEMGDGVSDFTLLDGNVSRIRAWAYRPVEKDRPSWQTRNGGKSWRTTGDAPDGPPPPSRQASASGVQFAATSDGLVGNRGTAFRTLDLNPGKKHCVLVTPKDPSAGTKAQLVGRLRAAGYRAEVEGEAVELHMTDAEIEAFFGEPVTYRRAEKSSGPGSSWQAHLGEAIPRKWRPHMASATVGHGICE